MGPTVIQVQHVVLVTCALLIPTSCLQPCTRLSVSNESVTLMGTKPLPLVLWQLPSSSSTSSSSSSSASQPAVTMATQHTLNKSYTRQQPIYTSPSSFPSGAAGSSSGLCWGTPGGGAVAFTPDHHNNLWAVTTTTLGSEVIPGRVWLLNFTSLTWRHLDPPPSPPAPQPAPQGTTSQVKALPQSSTPSPPPPVVERVAVCWGRGGLVLVVSASSTFRTWFFHFESGRWRSFLSPSMPLAPTLLATWCSPSQEMWLLTSPQPHPNSPHSSHPPHHLIPSQPSPLTTQTLWRLDGQGKWSSLQVSPGRGNQGEAWGQWEQEDPLLSWSDVYNDLYLLRKAGGSSTVVVVRFDTGTGEMTVTALGKSSWRARWVAGMTGDLYAIIPGHSTHDPTWLLTYDYHTGKLLNEEMADVRSPLDHVFIRVNTTIHTTIPACPTSLSPPATARPPHHNTSAPPAHHTAPSPHHPRLRLSHITLSRGCHHAHSLMQGPREATVLSQDLPNQHGTLRTREGESEEVGGEGYQGERYLGEKQQGERHHGERHQGERRQDEDQARGHRKKVGMAHTDGKSADIIMVQDEQEVQSGSPANSRPRDRSDAHDSIIFFSLSLSIFALVGIVAFVRRCVRCPPSRGLDEVAEERGKPPSPLPVLYSIVPDDPGYDTPSNDSPTILAPDHHPHQLYDPSAPYTDLPPPHLLVTSTPVPTPTYIASGGVSPCGGISPGALTPSTISPYAITPGAISPYSVSPGAISSYAVTSGAATPSTMTPGALTPTASPTLSGGERQEWLARQSTSIGGVRQEGSIGSMGVIRRQEGSIVVTGRQDGHIGGVTGRQDGSIGGLRYSLNQPSHESINVDTNNALNTFTSTTQL